MASDFDRQALLNIFTTEASDGLLTLANALDPRDGSTPTQEALREHFIIAHSLTGASALYGFPGGARLAKILARMLEQAGTVAPADWSGTLTTLRDIVTILTAQIDNINQKSTEDPTIFEDLKARYTHLLREFEPTPPSAEPAPEEASLPDSYFRPDLEAEILEYFVPEAQEYLEAISSCLLRMEKDPANTDTIHQLFRAAHTLKGSAYTVGFQAIGDLTHHLEDIMGAIRDGKMQVTAELTDLFFHAVDEVRLLLGRDPTKLPQIRQEFSPLQQRLQQTAIGQAEKEPPPPVATPTTALTETTPRREELPVAASATAEPPIPAAAAPEALPQPLSAKGVRQGTVRASRDRLERRPNLLRTSIHQAREDMGLLQQMTAALRDEIARTRMVPIGSLFTRFQKAVREMARTVGKDVEVVFSGANTEVDAGVVQRLAEPLIHMMRKAVAHGIEPPAVRKAGGTPEKGTLYLHALNQHNTIVIEIEDDGAGLNIEKIKAKAIALGLVRPERAAEMPPADLIELIYLPGFSTSEEVGDQAGRGIGMDVIRRAVTDLNGQIDIETEPGVGTKFTLTLPLTMLISTAL